MVSLQGNTRLHQGWKMNHREYEALFDDTHISDRERSLYLYLRSRMDFKTGVVGIRSKISYKAIQERLEYVPQRGSKEPAFYPSTDQIKRLLQKLVGYGWIERQHTGLRESMVFLLPLANTDLNRPQEERQRSATRGAPQGKPQGNAQNIRPLSDMSATSTAKGAPQDDRHTSVSPNKDLSLNAREEFEPGIAGEELKFSDQFLRLARNLGLSAISHPDQEVKSIFELFRTYGHRANTEMQMPAWLNDWRSWVNREKVRYEKQQCSYQQPKQPGGNAVANALRTARNYQGAPQGAGNDDW